MGARRLLLCRTSTSGTGVGVVSGSGTDVLDRVVLRDVDTGAQTDEAGMLFAMISGEPRTDWLDGVLARDDRASRSPARR